MNRFLKISLIILSFIILSWFYWFQWRPAQIRTECYKSTITRFEGADIRIPSITRAYDTFYNFCLHKYGLP